MGEEQEEERKEKKGVIRHVSSDGLLRAGCSFFHERVFYDS